eukprot:686429-Hanusia_phi.AAC.1
MLAKKDRGKVRDLNKKTEYGTQKVSEGVEGLELLDEDSDTDSDAVISPLPSPLTFSLLPSPPLLSSPLSFCILVSSAAQSSSEEEKGRRVKFGGEESLEMMDDSEEDGEEEDGEEEEGEDEEEGAEEGISGEEMELEKGEMGREGREACELVSGMRVEARWKKSQELHPG